MSQMDQITQNNAASAEESASASEELSGQAESVQQTVHTLQELVGGVQSRAGNTGSIHVAIPARQAQASRASVTATSGEASRPLRNPAKSPGLRGQVDDELPLPAAGDDFKNF